VECWRIEECSIAGRNDIVDLSLSTRAEIASSLDQISLISSEDFTRLEFEEISILEWVLCSLDRHTEGVEPSSEGAGLLIVLGKGGSFLCLLRDPSTPDVVSTRVTLSSIKKVRVGLMLYDTEVICSIGGGDAPALSGGDMGPVRENGDGVPAPLNGASCLRYST
jgi:hypothetical protein